MNGILAKKPTAGQFAALASTAVAGLIAARYAATPKTNTAERMAASLLDTQRLSDAALKAEESPEAALAGCAAYLASVALGAAPPLGVGTGTGDPIGFTRLHTHPYTRAEVSVRTESCSPDQAINYSVSIPNVGEVRGTRHVGGLKLGLPPKRPTPDTLQISLGDSYTAQIESEIYTAELIVIGKAQVYGSATLHDNRGNVGRLNIGGDGSYSGTVTRAGRIVGRFNGKIGAAMNFKQYQIPSAA